MPEVATSRGDRRIEPPRLRLRRRDIGKRVGETDLANHEPEVTEAMRWKRERPFGPGADQLVGKRRRLPASTVGQCSAGREGKGREQRLWISRATGERQTVLGIADGAGNVSLREPYGAADQPRVELHAVRGAGLDLCQYVVGVPKRVVVAAGPVVLVQTLGRQPPDST